MKPATSAHQVADVIPFLAYIIFYAALTSGMLILIMIQLTRAAKNPFEPP